MVATECLPTDRRSRAQTQEFANLTTELLGEQRGAEIQLEGMRMGVKVEKSDMHNGDKSHDLDTWLFQVRKHLNLTVIPERGHVLYVASLLCSNAMLWWRETCEGDRHPAMWDDFCRVLHEQFWPEDYRRGGAR